MTADLGGAIAGIYDTVHSDAHWPAALDGLAAGVGSRGAILVGGALVACNRELNRIFDLKDGIALSRTGRLECGNTGKSAELGAAIAAVAATSGGEGQTEERLVFVERRSGKRPYLIEVAPLRDVTGEVEQGFAGAVVFVVDPENSVAISTQRLAALFMLSPAEAEVARAMVDGLSASEIADMRGTSEDTVRSQFKSIYAKTGVHRRADLVRLAIN